MTWFDLTGRAWCRISASDVTMQVRALGPSLWRSFGRPPLVGAVGVIALAVGSYAVAHQRPGSPGSAASRWRALAPPGSRSGVLR
jgi:hypothetical protein